MTFDLFSALTDSRTGGARVFGGLAEARGWALSGADIYDEWDAQNKRLQRDARPPVTFHELSRHALGIAYGRLHLPREQVDQDLELLEESVADWPLWPDVVDGLRAVAARVAVGILSNVDDTLARTTRAHALVDPDLVLTSQNLGAYKPDRAIYDAARRRIAPRLLRHVAASARDTRGSIEAGVDTIRIVRPGHTLDPDGPAPPHEIGTVVELLTLL